MRPTTITTDQISSWSKKLDEEKEVPSSFKEDDKLREMLYASYWLSEELVKLSCPSHKIVQVQYALGQLATKIDPWEVAESLLYLYNKGEIKFKDEELERELEKLKDKDIPRDPKTQN
jgi:hypothetical protein